MAEGAWQTPPELIPYIAEQWQAICIPDLVR